MTEVAQGARCDCSLWCKAWSVTAVCAAALALTGCTGNPVADAARSVVGAARSVVGDAHVQHLTVHSAALAADMKVDVYLPPGYTKRKKYAVIYLLHGKDANQNSWMSTWFGGGIHIDQDATRLIKAGTIPPVILVSPEIDNSYGIDTAQKRHSVGGYTRGQYATYLSHDLVNYIDAHYSAIDKPSGRVIGGYSMGGFAALHLAFTRPDLYGKVGVMSAALWVGLPQVLLWIYPTARDQAARDPITIAEHHKLHVPVEMIEGKSDPFYGADTKLAAVLHKSDSAPVHYYQYPGAHNEVFWRSHATQLLKFLAGTKQ